MARFQFVLATAAAPEAVRAALLDFSERRPELWPGLPRDQYEVYEVGDTWAEVREGYRGPIWWRERYDWSMPGRIEWVAVDSGFGAPGSRVVVEIEPAAGGGSTVHVTWDRRGRTPFGKLFIGLMALTRGFFIRRSLEAGLARIAATRA
jgi:polyketide cyclase/dehydrase/lipid transport protein